MSRPIGVQNQSHGRWCIRWLHWLLARSAAAVCGGMKKSAISRAAMVPEARRMRISTATSWTAGRPADSARLRRYCVYKRKKCRDALPADSRLPARYRSRTRRADRCGSMVRSTTVMSACYGWDGSIFHVSPHSAVRKSSRVSLIRGVVTRVGSTSDHSGGEPPTSFTFGLRVVLPRAMGAGYLSVGSLPNERAASSRSGSLEDVSASGNDASPRPFETR